jgi:hypothetical protein
MAVPANQTDAKRIHDLLDMLMDRGNRVELSVYVGTSNKDSEVYLSLEVRGYSTPEQVSEFIK